MDLATVIGIVLAWGAVIFSMWHASEGALGAYFKPPEMFLVFGGAIGAAMLSMPLHTVTGAVNYLKKWLFNKDAHIEHVIKEMVQYAETARRDGVLALEPWPAKRPMRFSAAGCSSRSTAPIRKSSNASSASKSKRCRNAISTASISSARSRSSAPASV